MFRGRSRQAASDTPALISSGLALLQAGDRAGALRQFAKAAKTGDALSQRSLGSAYLQAGDTVQAEQCFRRAMAAGVLDAQNDLGVLLKQTGRLGEAEFVLRQAADAGDPNALNNVGNIFSERGDLQGAAWFWHRAALAGLPRAMCSLATYLAGTEYRADARQWYELALAKVDEAPDLRQQLENLNAILTGPSPGPGGAAGPSGPTPPPATSPDSAASDPGLAAYQPTMLHRAFADASEAGPSSSAEALAAPVAPSTPVDVTDGPIPAARPPAPQPQPDESFEPTELTRVRRPRRDPVATGPEPADSDPTDGQPSGAQPTFGQPSGQQPAGPGTRQVRPAQATRMDTGLVQPATPPARIPAEGKTVLIDRASLGLPLPGTSSAAGTSSAPGTSVPTESSVPGEPAAPSESPASGGSSVADSASTARLRSAGPDSVQPETARLRRPRAEPGEPASPGSAPAPAESVPGSAGSAPVPAGSAPAPAEPVRDTIYHLRITEGLREQYLQTGTAATLEMAIESSQMALDAVTQGDPQGRALALGTRCVLLRMAYQRDEDPARLAQAIDAGRTALTLTGPNDPAYARHVSNLASALQEEYGRSRATDVLDEALETYRRAAGALPPESPELAGMLSNIGNVLLTQGLEQQSQPLLTEAVEVAREAVGATDPDAPSFGTRLASLGMALVAHYANCGRPAGELDEAERVLNVALGTLPPDHPLHGQVQDYLSSVSALRSAS